MTTRPSTTGTRPRTSGRVAPRIAGVAIGVLWAYLFGAVVTLPPWGASPYGAGPVVVVPDVGLSDPELVPNGAATAVFAAAAALALAIAVIIRFRPAVFGGVALGLAVFLVVGWLIGPWFGVGLTRVFEDPLTLVGFASTIVRQPAVVAVFVLIIGLAVMRRRSGR